MIFNTLEDEMEFGKFKGMTWSEILIIHPDYLTWAVENLGDGYFYVTDNALEEIRMMFPSFKMDQSFYRNVEAQRDSFDTYWEENDNHHEIENNDFYDEPATYERYGGSYAQDVMGYSDDDIDTIFDGDPLAYWNID